MTKYLRCLTLLVVMSGLCYAQTYVGPEKCLQCHNNPTLGDATGWRTSMHANGYSYVPDDSHSMEKLKGIINDYDQNGVDDFKDGLDFNKISSVFDPYKPNAPVLSYDSQNGYQIKIGEVAHRVYITYGGSGLYKQRYMVKIKTAGGESAGYYVSPIQFNEKTHEYVLYHPDAWYDANDKPIYTAASTFADAAQSSRNMAKGCAGCHVTGLSVKKDSNGEWTLQGAPVADEAAYANYNNIFDIDGDGDLDQMNTTCERCHGPGGDHASAPTKANIINPEDLTPDEANNLCGMCHSRGHSLPNGTFSYPFNDNALTSWKVGDMVKDYYSDGGGYWGDKKNSKKHHQQFFDFYRSPKPTFKYEKVRCFNCHDVHNTEKHHIVTSVEEEDSQGNPIEIATDNDNNTLCLSCHATHGPFKPITKEMVADFANNETAIAAIISKHTNHSYDPENKNSTGGASRCSKCHMPKIAKSAIAYDIHSHTFEAISPAKTLKYDMPNSCAVSCHNKNNYTFGVDMSADVFTSWNEQTDKNLAAHLLFWYENQWFHETNPDGNVVNAKLVRTPPTLDGDDTDAAWAGTDYATIPLANEKSVDVKAVFTSTDLYMLFKWADPTASFTRSGSWSYDGSAWKTSSGQGEDRIAIMWNMSVPEAAWNGRGCMNKCHRNVDNKDPNQDKTTSEDDAYLPRGQKADMWHMKAARSLPATNASATNVTVDPATHEVTAGTISMVGYMDDKYIGPFDANNAPDGGRYGDAGQSTYSRNRNAAKTGPKYIETAPADFMDAMVLTQTEVDGGEAVEVDNLSASDVQTYWAKYAALNAVVPERILHAPAGSRGDIMQAAKWVDGYWITEIKRALNTGNSDDDAIFAPNGSYAFGIALMNNSGGDKHWTTGKAVATLNLGTTGVAERLTDVPGDFNLAQNYPNPFNPSTVIEFTVPRRGKVELKVFSSLGREVTVLVNKDLQAGTYKVNFNAKGLTSGLYYYRMTAPGYVATRKMVLMK
ncbi:MAG: T9SS type A sorting domain-containing protein [Chlorobi bacterium]|nr:T9SS type A sorting domain-containing protein [Chlorobiota bacterium]